MRDDERPALTVDQLAEIEKSLGAEFGTWTSDSESASRLLGEVRRLRADIEDMRDTYEVDVDG